MNLHTYLKRIYHQYFNPHKKYQMDLQYFGDSAVIIDIGCGKGFFATLAPERIVGLDRNLETLEQIVQERFRVLCGKADQLPFRHESVDGIYCSHVIEHLYQEQAYELLRQIARILRPGGILVLKSPLPHPGFYDEFSHVKPYPPNAVLRYFWDLGTQETYARIPCRFELVALKWDYARLFYPPIEPVYLSRKLGRALFFKALSLFLFAIGLHSWRRVGYTLVLRKLKTGSEESSGSGPS